MTVFTAAVLQMRSGTNPDTNAQTLETLVAEAVGRGAHYLQTPEMTGMVQRDRAGLDARLATEESDVIVRTASALALRHRVFLHIGSVAVAVSGGMVANRAFLFGPDGERIATYDKIHMFDVDLDSGESWRESKTYQAGGAATLADLSLPGGSVRLGFAVCYDMRFPQLFHAEALAGAEVLTAPAAFTRQTGEAHWHVLLRARAIENGAYVIAAAQGGTHEDGRETYGHSLIVDPWGRIVGEVDGTEPGVAIAEIDTAAVGEARRKIPNLRNARDFLVSPVVAGRNASEAAE
ncbi:MAG: carbon-nitrogen hydrolase family protein [Rhizobiaceae bacterium]|nr:carbon-nitrogen hydrolase family protein [Rhizobiaceae bacterium]